MVYINDVTTEQTLLIPKVRNKRGSIVDFKITSSFKSGEVMFNSLPDFGNKEYFKINIRLEDLIPKGEYLYEIIQDNEVLSSGLAIVEGDSNVDYRQDNITIKVKQYEQN